jgi:outer membrane protein, heavy metal efflux system
MTARLLEMRKKEKRKTSRSKFRRAISLLLAVITAFQTLGWSAVTAQDRIETTQVRQKSDEKILPADGDFPQTAQLIKLAKVDLKNSAQDQNQSVVTLQELIAEALEKNPEIAAAKRRVDVKRARIPQASALPDPVLSVTSMGNVVPFWLQKGDPSSARIVGFTQDIPYPGKLSLKGKAARMETEAELYSYEQTWRNVVTNLKTAYYDLYFIDRSLTTVSRTKTLLEQFLKIAEARYEVGKGLQQDVLKAQTEISILLERQIMLQQRRRSTVALINSILLRSPEEPLGQAADVKKSELPFTLESLYEVALNGNPEIRRQERMIDGSQYRLTAARKDYYPDFGVNVQYLQRDRMPDMWGFGVNVKIPLYFGQRQRPAVQEAAAELAGARQEYESLRAQTMFRVKDYYLTATTAARLLQLYETGVIPQAALTLESSIASYQVGTSDFLTLLTNLVTVLTYELNYYEQLANYQKALVQLEPLIGVELAR